MNKVNYFEARQVNANFYKDFKLPAYFWKVLPKDKGIRILDIGCGFGQTMRALKNLGYKNVYGIDVSEEAINFCIKQGLNIELKRFINYCLNKNLILLS